MIRDDKNDKNMTPSSVTSILILAKQGAAAPFDI